MMMRSLPIIVVVGVGSSILSTSFAQQHDSSHCSNLDQSTCCEMTFNRFGGARDFCIHNGCNHNVCSGKPSGYGNDGTWIWARGWGGATATHNDAWGVDSWGGDASKQWGGWGVERGVFSPTFSPTFTPTFTPTAVPLSPVWSAPRSYERSKNYYPPPAPRPYYSPTPPAPKFVETCCISGDDVCQSEFAMEKQILFSGKARVCCVTRLVHGGVGGHRNSYGEGTGYEAPPSQYEYEVGGYQNSYSYGYRGGGRGYHSQTPPYPYRYGNGYGGYGHRNRRKLQYQYKSQGYGGYIQPAYGAGAYGQVSPQGQGSYGYGGGGYEYKLSGSGYGNGDSYRDSAYTYGYGQASPQGQGISGGSRDYGDSYGLQQCHSPEPTPLTTRRPTPEPTVPPSNQPSDLPSNVPSNKPSDLPSNEPSNKPSDSFPPLVWKGVNGCTPESPCGVCTGDCDSNEGCMPGLECLKRSGSEQVPGCTSGGIGDIPGADYCYALEAFFLQSQAKSSTDTIVSLTRARASDGSLTLQQGSSQNGWCAGGALAPDYYQLLLEECKPNSPSIPIGNVEQMDQLWSMDPDGNIRSIFNSERCMMVSSSAVQFESPIEIGPCNLDGVLNQFYYESESSSFPYTLKLQGEAYASLCVTFLGNEPSRGAEMVLGPCENQAKFGWDFIPVRPA